jgi:hypothetical protein
MELPHEILVSASAVLDNSHYARGSAGRIRRPGMDIRTKVFVTPSGSLISARFEFTSSSSQSRCDRDLKAASESRPWLVPCTASGPTQ